MAKTDALKNDAKLTKIFDYNPDRGCLFYQPVATHEDCDPYLDNTLSVVCDGSGGAGGFYHEINMNKLNTYEKIKKLVLPEDKDDVFKDYIEKMYEPILSCKDEKIKKTSAFFASRIVMPRFIYAYKTLGKERIKNITAFIVEGMKHFAEELKLKSSDLSDKALLPTTFVSIAITNETKNDVEFDVYWAGDSRAYYLSPKGLKQLSLDDEDESGAINNLFSLLERKKPAIRVKHYKMAKPCFLFTCSDGYFDVFPDNLSVDFATSYWLANSNTMQDVAKNLQRFYEPRVNDDCTFSLLSFGFENMKEIKDKMTPHVIACNELLKLNNSHTEEIKFRENEAVLDDYIRRLNVRSKDMLPDILKAISKAYKEGSKDPFVNGPVKDLIIPSKEVIDELEATKNLKKYLKNNYHLVDFPHTFDCSSFSEEQEILFESVTSLSKEIAPYMAINLQYVDLVAKYDAALEEYHDTYVQIVTEQARAKEFNIKKYRKTIDLLGKFKKEVEKNKENKYFDIVSPTNMSVINKFYKAKEALDKLGEKRAEIIKNIRSQGKSESLLHKEIEKLFVAIPKLLKCINYETCNNDEIIQIADSIKPLKNRKPIDIDRALLRVYNPYSDKDGYNRIIEGRLDGSLLDTVTIIDYFYNPTLLKKTITFTKIKNSRSSAEAKEIDGIIKQLKKFEADVLSELTK